MRSRFSSTPREASDYDPAGYGGARTGGTVQRRTQLRFVVSLEIGLRSESNFWVVSANNISEGGVFIATKELKPIGSRVEINIRLPEPFGMVWTLGEVRWIRDTPAGAEAPLGMGVRFDGIGEEGQQAIRAFLAARPPISFT
jgi:uncharacterized protein (TIGR02266 family)